MVKTKIAEGFIEKKRTRKTRNGDFAHEFDIGKRTYSIFSSDEWSFLKIGDYVRWLYRTNKLSGGSRRTYYKIVLESIEVLNPAEQAESTTGYVYVLSNQSMRGVRKIGFTTSTPTARAAELSSSTGVPTPFNVDWFLAIEGDPGLVERSVHARPSSSRHGKEFFRVSLERAKETILSAYGALYPKALDRSSQILEDRKEVLNERRKKALNQIEEERRKKIYQSSPEYLWKTKGYTCLKTDRNSALNEPASGFWSRFIRKAGPDWLHIRIIGRQGCLEKGVPPWRFMAEGSHNGRRVNSTTKVTSVGDCDDIRDCIRMTKNARRQYPTANYSLELELSNELLHEPRLPIGASPVHKYGDIYVLWVSELEELHFRELSHDQSRNSARAIDNPNRDVFFILTDDILFSTSG